MNVQTMARMAYAHATTPVRTDRGTEYEIFARVTRAMKSAGARGKPGFKDLAQAVLENRRLWSVLAVDAADEGNELPESLRAQVIFLAEFTNQHSSQVLNGKATADVLVDINASMMRGLRGGTGG